MTTNHIKAYSNTQQQSINHKQSTKKQQKQQEDTKNKLSIQITNQQLNCRTQAQKNQKFPFYLLQKIIIYCIYVRARARFTSEEEYE